MCSSAPGLTIGSAMVYRGSFNPPKQESVWAPKPRTPNPKPKTPNPKPKFVRWARSAQGLLAAASQPRRALDVAWRLLGMMTLKLGFRV